jgi:hypothetical protein
MSTLKVNSWLGWRIFTVNNRRALLRPNHRHGSTSCEPNRRPHSFVCVPRPHLAAGELAPAVEGTTAKPSFPKGPMCKSRGHHCEHSKLCRGLFVVLLVTKPTTFAKLVYTFELQFLHEKLKSILPRSVVLPNPHTFMSWFLDMLWVLACVGSVQKLAQSYWVNRFYDLSCIYAFSALMICVAKSK